MLNQDALAPLKRIEIILGEEGVGHLQEICKIVDVRGYTYIKHAEGNGVRDERSPDTFGLEEENIIVNMACLKEQAEELVDLLAPKLKELDGICLISDCEWKKRPPGSN